jgi:hypothetical protein
VKLAEGGSMKTDCAVEHVIQNEDFGVKPDGSTARKIARIASENGKCKRCGRIAAVRLCRRCGDYFCAEAP